MNYITITKEDMLNGDGIRVVLWVSGCELHCQNCHNPETWDKNFGKEFTTETLIQLLEYLDNDYISGITYTGGHPIEEYNLSYITSIAKTIKEKFPLKTQWLYSGYVWDKIKDLEIIKYLDVVVDGPYINELRDVSLKWRGSSNQRVIDVKKSLELGQVVLWCD